MPNSIENRECFGKSNNQYSEPGQIRALVSGIILKYNSGVVILVNRAALHRRSDKDILLHDCVDKALWLDNSRLTGSDLLARRKRCICHVFCTDQPLDAAVVVDMRMANNNGDNAGKGDVRNI